MTRSKRFLIAPLDWGLGHATRCIPIARALLRRGQEVLLAAQGAPARLLHRELPDLRIVPIVNYDMRYGTTVLGLYARFPFMLLRVAMCAARERRQTARLVSEHRIDAVIADNRFGCHSSGAYSVYLTHQMRIRMPAGFGWLERGLAAVHRGVVDKYDMLWVPDVPDGNNLTGELMPRELLPDNHRFVGPLSRFERTGDIRLREAALDLLVMLSGPEPQRSLFERQIRHELAAFDGRAVVLLGKPGVSRDRQVDGRVTYLSHVSGERMQALLLSAKAIVCRAGYTSIMELAALGRTAVLVPTPGQTEQEYLARRLDEQGRFVACDQRGFRLAAALERLQSLDTTALSVSDHPALLEQAVSKLLGTVASRSQ
ncbi:MAG: hypothetical protein GF331_24235 [Chitinivibrionales bacterium]|nr:hypothetical protein [Chitinivibrionales bacterium]